VFLHGKFHHPPHIFKSIVFGEAVRLKRLNDLDHHYHNNLHTLRNKYALSSFHMSMVDDILAMAATWTERFPPLGPNGFLQKKLQSAKKFQNAFVWASPFTQCLSLTEKEKSLIPEATIVYKNPITLRTSLTNNKSCLSTK